MLMPTINNKPTYYHGVEYNEEKDTEAVLGQGSRGLIPLGSLEGMTNRGIHTLHPQARHLLTANTLRRGL
jgi:hypothetical protein